MTGPPAATETAAPPADTSAEPGEAKGAAVVRPSRHGSGTETVAPPADTSAEPGEAKGAAVVRPSRDGSGREPAGAFGVDLNPSLIATKATGRHTSQTTTAIRGGFRSTPKAPA